MKICSVIFSSNRIEYLSKTLEARQKINWDGCQVDHILIDDMPYNRHDTLIKKLCYAFNIHEVYLHEENKGLSVTWSEFWKLIADRDYDFVWHMEDDVLITESFQMTDIMGLLLNDPNLTQICLKRQKWYSNEPETTALETDRFWQYHYRYEHDTTIFSPMASLYHMNIVRYPYSKWYKDHYPNTNLSEINLNEGMIGKLWAEEYGMRGGRLKTKDGLPMCHHIGEWFTGKRVLPNEPNYSDFAKYDPFKKYCSRTGNPWL